MSINIKATHLTLTPAIEQYLEKKLFSSPTIIDFNADNVVAQVELAKTTNHHKSGSIFKAEISARVDGHNFRASCEEEDLYVAIDQLKDAIFQEVKAHKDKLQSKQRKGGAELKKLVREA